MVKNSLKDERTQKRRFWERHIEDCSRRGSSQVEYCREHKLSTKSFTYWKRRIRQTGSISFVPLRVKPEAQNTSSNSSALVLCKDGYRIEIEEDFIPAMLATVLRTLRDL